MIAKHDLATSAALWNRAQLDLRSDEILAQLLDRGSLEDWRALYRLATSDESLQRRILAVVREVPLPLPHFWLAALASLGTAVDFDMSVKPYGTPDI